MAKEGKVKHLKSPGLPSYDVIGYLQHLSVIMLCITLHLTILSCNNLDNV